MRRMWRLACAAWYLLLHALYLSVAAHRLPPRRRVRLRAAEQQRALAKVCRTLNIHVELEGTIPRGQPLLVVCNHYGVLDPVVLASLLPVALVGNAGIARWPLIGWLARQAAVIFVDRRRRSQAGTFVASVRNRLADGVPVLVFPEGTTTRASGIRPFKTGAFAAVAGNDGMAVLPLHLEPIAVAGVPAMGAVRDRLVWADAAPSFGRHVWDLLGLPSVTLRLRVGTPIDTHGLDRKQLAAIAHEAVVGLAGAPGFSTPHTHAA